MAAWWAAALRCLGVDTGYPVPGIAEPGVQSASADPARSPWRAPAPPPAEPWVLAGCAECSCARPRPGCDVDAGLRAPCCVRFVCADTAWPVAGCAALADVDRLWAALPWPVTPGIAAPPGAVGEPLCAAAATLKRYRLYCCISWMSFVP